jgi:hypothetical protein
LITYFLSCLILFNFRARDDDDDSKHNKYCHFCQHVKVKASAMLACSNKGCARRFCEQCLVKQVGLLVDFLSGGFSMYIYLQSIAFLMSNFCSFLLLQLGDNLDPTSCAFADGGWKCPICRKTCCCTAPQACTILHRCGKFGFDVRN